MAKRIISLIGFDCLHVDGTYDVKYVIGGGESGVDPQFVTIAEELTLDRRARKRVGPELLTQQETPPRSTRQRSGKRARSKAGVPSSQRTPLAPIHLNLQSPSSSRSSSPGLARQRRYDNIMVLGTHLEPNEQKWLETFATTFGVQVAHQFCDEVTHVITHAAEVM